ncbi:hypothetical protein FGU71_13435 [Erythrobacter insulae]|uniref:PH domain-containing protein n=1 Tax=Erythrobacter insulae TaxID=2584124 RepID=A0A547P785_9SPHN|nr:hypothetical protein [Erythrobacter insulae]TRD09997.1 hypothetical protein FGU71_13435 [Erythrobacter insulae]
MFALTLVELFVVHFLVALKWPLIGWTLTTVSAISALWILLWIRSFRTKPHQLSGDALTLNFGSLKTIELDCANIAQVRRSWEQGALEKKGHINLAGIAFPNRCIELLQPLENGRDRIFVRLDDPDAFDAALLRSNVTFA